MAKKKINTSGNSVKTADYRHTGAKRTNNPTAKNEGEGTIPNVPKAVYHYNPHLSPVLRFDPTGAPDKLPELICEAGKRPLTTEEQKLLADALRKDQPWFEWAGKREQHEKGYFEVDPVALHIHERVSAQAIVRTAMREDVQRDLFADPQQSYKESVQFYKHDVDWANRLILGDSLQVMSSLARRENLAGKVQMIYMDPPYGIKFSSNFQPEVGKRDVKENDVGLPRSPEMVKAYRDTWALGVHSYLEYLRTRIVAAKDLLSPSGSLFVQISDENLHRVRNILDEIFGPENFQSVIAYRTSVPLKSTGLAGITDYILWFSRDHEQMKRHDLFMKREAGEGIYSNIEEPNGHRRSLTKEERENLFETELNGRIFGTDNLVSSGYTPTCIYDIEYEGKKYSPTSGKSWKTNRSGMARLLKARRVNASGATVRAMMYVKDYPVQKLTNLWTDVKGETDKEYVVQTSSKVVARCMLMTTDPGDLVLDPTCGGGTTAYVAENWGRRWITIDTSRVALSIARQRIITSRFEHYRTKEPGGFGAANPAAGFILKTVPHVTLKSIAQSTNLDSIFEKHDGPLDAALAACNSALTSVDAETRKKLLSKMAEKTRNEGKRRVTEADRRRWEIPLNSFEHWTIPYDTDADWPSALKNSVEAYLKAWIAKMGEVNKCIQDNAEQEELVDQPDIVEGILRVSGPFTVEGVRPEELSLSEEGLFDGTPNEFEVEEALAPYNAQNLQSYLAGMFMHLRADGLTFLNNKRKRFVRLESLYESNTGTMLHAEGIWEDGATDGPNTVAVVFGPQYGPVTALQVEEAIRATKRYDELVIAGFSFDAAATEEIGQNQHPKLKIHQAFIRPDINPGMEGLLKETPNSQLFSVFGQPEVDVKKTEEGYVVTMNGVDIYDPILNTVSASGAEKVAAWFLDSDYDGRCFCITQAFFPNQDAWEKISNALKGSADPEAFEAFNGTESLPFVVGKHKRIAVKVIDPRGNEVMAVKSLTEK